MATTPPLPKRDDESRALAVIAALDSLACARYGFVDHEAVIEQGLVVDPDGAVRLDAKVRSGDGSIMVHRPPQVWFVPGDTTEDLIDRVLGLLDMDRTELLVLFADHDLIDLDDYPEVLFSL